MLFIQLSLFAKVQKGFDGRRGELRALGGIAEIGTGFEVVSGDSGKNKRCDRSGHDDLAFEKY